MAFKEKIVISIGGSLIVPNSIDVKFLSKLNAFIREEIKLKKQRQFFLVAGGGKTARFYIKAGQNVIGHELTADDLDWLGIHSTRLNAHLLRTIFRDIAHPYILKHYNIIQKPTKPVVIASGWKPGSSTDYDAVLICEDYGAKTVINLSNIDKVYDKDPKKYKNARAKDKISWYEFRKMVGNKWIPGMNAPFDPIAAKKAEKLGIKVCVLSGRDFKNIKKCLEGKEFIGTVIE